MKEFVVRTLLTIDFLLAAPTFLALIWVSPERYADTLAHCGRSIRLRTEQFRREGRHE